VIALDLVEGENIPTVLPVLVFGGVDFTQMLDIVHPSPILLEKNLAQFCE
jgi:hypothetical protein